MYLLKRLQSSLSVLNKKRGENGFSLVELMVTMGILIAVTTMLFFNYPEFRQKVSLKRTSQEIALAIRQAQTYGLGVREFQSGGTTYFPGYGIHFDLTNSPSSFILFADISDPKNYSYDPSNENVQTFSIQTNDKILSMCGAIDVNCDTPLSTADIIYYRPNPIVILTNNGGTTKFSYIEITIQSPEGGTKTITVWLSGQISIE